MQEAIGLMQYRDDDSKLIDSNVYTLEEKEHLYDVKVII